MLIQRTSSPVRIVQAVTTISITTNFNTINDHQDYSYFVSPLNQAAAPAGFSYLLIVISTFPSGITGPHSTSILFT